MDDLIQDLRFAARSLRKSAGFTVVALLTLALGIGANTAIFSVVNGVLLRPLAYDQPDRLVTIAESNPVQDREGFNVSYPNYLEWKKQSRVFEQIAAVRTMSVTLTGGDEAARVLLSLISRELFAVLRVEPALGRGFLAEEDRPGADPVVILSHGLWQRRFGADPEVVGKTIAINGSSSTVIGVMPPEFEFPSEDVELWAPIGLLADRMQNRAVHTLTTVARLEDGVSLDEAKVEMATIAARIQREFPGEDPEHSTTLIPLHERVVGNTDTILLVLMGAVAFLLLIACANVADLLMARAAARQKEIAVRTALGASRWRVIRQLVTESVLLGLTGGAAALALAFWGLDLLIAHLPPFMPRVEQIGIDGRVLLFTLLISLLTGLIFGLLPALKASKLDIVGSLKDLVTSAAGGARDRSRRVLVIAQVALSLVLLVGAGLMIKSFWRLQDVDPGFEPQNLLTMTVSLAGSPKFTTSEEVIAFYADLRGRLEALPGVSSASAVNALPISGGDSDGELTIEGRPFASGAAPGASFRRILPNYFRTAGIPIVQGREFGERDRGEEPFVVIITETMAGKYWPSGDAVGTRIKVGPPENEPWLTIVGVAADVRNIGLATEPRLATYEPHTQRPWSTMNVMVRTAIDPLSVVRGVRDEIRQAGGDLPVFNIGTMRERISRSVSTERFNMILLTIFATVALLLAAIGLYGVIAYSVSHRTRELGIRIALGAERKDIVNLVVRQGIPLLGAGVALGLIAAVGLTRFLAGLLFAVSPLDATIFVAVAALLAAVALLASYVPARRATAVDPMQALRAE